MNKLKNFVEKKNINPNETSEWVKLLKDVIKEFKLESKVAKDELSIFVTSKEEYTFLQKAMFYVEETETTLDYIFEGNVVMCKN